VVEFLFATCTVEYNVTRNCICI